MKAVWCILGVHTGFSFVVNARWWVAASRVSTALKSIWKPHVNSSKSAVIDWSWTSGAMGHGTWIPIPGTICSMKELRYLSLCSLKPVYLVLLLPVSFTVLLLTLLFLRKNGQTHLFQLWNIPDFPPRVDDRDHGGSSQSVVYHQWDHWKSHRQVSWVLLDAIPIL